MIPSPNPWSTLPARTCGMLLAIVAMAVPVAKTSAATISVLRAPNRTFRLAAKAPPTMAKTR